MLPSQRHLFDIPRDVAYLNAAAWSPLPLAVQEAGRMGVGRKTRPWEVDPALPGRVIERSIAPRTQWKPCADEAAAEPALAGRRSGRRTS